MKDRDIDQLMQDVLDGTASPEEAAELERFLGANAPARARFEEYTRLFRDLGRVPRVQPPDGFGPALMERVALRPVRTGGWRQLFSLSRVSRGSANGSRGHAPGLSARAHRGFQPGPHMGEWEMSEQQGNTKSNRKLWIGGGIAAAAAVVIVSQVGVDYPKSGDLTSGTIAPAQRYRAEQPTSKDVQVSSPSSPQGGQPTQAGESSTVNAASANQGTANQGMASSSNQGTANQGMASSANQGIANQAKSNQGTANQGMASSSNQGTANQAKSNQGTANQGTANQAKSNQGTANQGTANQAKSNQGTANQGTANQAKSNQGTANQGTANQGTANQGTANQALKNQAFSNQSTANEAMKK